MRSVATKMASVMIEVENNYKKLMLQHNKENKVEISVMAKEDYVMIIKIVEGEISIAKEKFYVATENGRDMRLTKTSMSRQRLQCCNKQFIQRLGLKMIMTRQRKSLSRQQTQENVRNSIAPMFYYVTKNIEKNHKKNVATFFTMS